MKNIEDLKEKYRSSCKNHINWKHWTEKPKERIEIWFLKWHSKCHFPSSFQIYGGEVEYVENDIWRVNTCDYDGGGCHCFYSDEYNNGFLFWYDKWEINIPEEMIKWDWDPGIY